MATLVASASRSNGPATIEEGIELLKYPKHEVLATGYTAGYESTGKYPESPSYGITYSGVKVKRDVFSTIAADLAVFPLGTILWIPGYGYGVVADKGAQSKGITLTSIMKRCRMCMIIGVRKPLRYMLCKKGAARCPRNS